MASPSGTCIIGKITLTKQVQHNAEFIPDLLQLLGEASKTYSGSGDLNAWARASSGHNVTYKMRIYMKHGTLPRNYG